VCCHLQILLTGIDARTNPITSWREVATVSDDVFENDPCASFLDGAFRSLTKFVSLVVEYSHTLQFNRKNLHLLTALFEPATIHSVRLGVTSSMTPPSEGSIDPKTDADQVVTQGIEWLSEHGDALYAFARSRVGRREWAEDLVQETFLAAVKAPTEFRGDASVRTWLISILRRKIVDHYRKSSATRETSIESFRVSQEHQSAFTSRGTWKTTPSHWKSPPEILEDREFWRVLEACLDKLPSPLSSAFKLREIDGVEIDSLSGSNAISAGNVRVRLHRARHLLRTCLEKNWFGNTAGKRANS